MSQLNCKWVSEGMKTINETHWEVGVPNELPEKNKLTLGLSGLFHYYKHPLLAVIFKDFHGVKYYQHLYQVVPEGRIVERFDKCGSTKLTLVKELEIPEVTNAQKIAFGILCSLETCKEESFVDWAEKWLSGKDRSKESALNIVCDFAKIYSAATAYHAACAAYIPSDLNIFNAINVANTFLKPKQTINVLPLLEKAIKIT